MIHNISISEEVPPSLLPAHLFSLPSLPPRFLKLEKQLSSTGISRVLGPKLAAKAIGPCKAVFLKT